MGGRLPFCVWEAVWWALERTIGCRTPEGRLVRTRCPSCGQTKTIPFSCKGRLCPSCGWLYAQRLMRSVESRLVRCQHRHLVFSVPANCERSSSGTADRSTHPATEGQLPTCSASCPENGPERVPQSGVRWPDPRVPEPILTALFARPPGRCQLRGSRSLTGPQQRSCQREPTGWLRPRRRLALSQADVEAVRPR